MHRDLVAALDVATAVILLLYLACVPFDLRFVPVIQAVAIGSCLLAGAHLALQWNRVRWDRLGGLLLLWTILTASGFLLRREEPANSMIADQTALAVAMTLAMVALLEAAFVRLETAGRSRWLARFLGAAALVFVWQYFTSFTSVVPRASLLSFARDSAGPQMMMLGLFAVLMSRDRSVDEFFNGMAGVGLLAFVGTFVVVVLAAAGGPELRLALARRGALAWVDPQGGFAAFAVQFPFYLHNRLGLFALLAGFSGLVVLQRHRRPWIKRAGYTVFVASFAVVLLTQTRGAMAGAGAGLAAFLVAIPSVRSTVRVGLVVAGVTLVVLTAGPPVRESIRKVVTPEVLTDPESTVNLRFHGFAGAWDMGMHHPAFGIGYGPYAFRQVYAADYRARLGDPEAKAHPYNSYLELLAGGGILPAALFTVLLAAGGVRLWMVRGRVPGASAALGLLVAVGGYALANTVLQYPLGGATWLLLAACAGLSEEGFTPPTHEDGA
ncbi:MAG: O-Antigen ligase [Candidatus Sumerlaeota bacterium]|nr:O-Antigen ligase [Candidatus Sumerlaeota bacterium]